MGMAIAARSWGCPDAHRIEGLLMAFGLPVKTDYSAPELYRFTLSDKKRSAKGIRLILPDAIGNCRVEAISLTQLQSFIEAGL